MPIDRYFRNVIMYWLYSLYFRKVCNSYVRRPIITSGLFSTAKFQKSVGYIQFTTTPLNCILHVVSKSQKNFSNAMVE